MNSLEKTAPGTALFPPVADCPAPVLPVSSSTELFRFTPNGGRVGYAVLSFFLLRISASEGLI
jgi:hypothetical protein